MKTEIVDTPIALDLLGKRLADAPLFSFDTETTGLDPWKHKAFMLSFCDGKGSWVVPLEKFKMDHVKHALSDAFGVPGKEVVGHNLKFDAHMAKETFGLELNRRWHDTCTQAFLLNENRSHKLKELMRVELKLETPEEAAVLAWLKKNMGAKENWDYSKVPREIMLPYSGGDAVGTFRLHEHQMKAIKQHFQGVYDTDCQALKVLYKMEDNGLLVDVPYFQGILPAMEKEAAEWLHGMWLDAGKEFNPDSDTELGDILFNKLKVVPTIFTSTGQPSTADKVLEAIDHPIIEKLRAYRSISHEISTNVAGVLERVDKNGRVHGNYSINRARTGRMSCSDPNLQNIKKDPKIRRGYLPEPGHVAWQFDLVQIELIGLAHYSQDPAMLVAARQGEDLHRLSASRVFKKPVAEITDIERRCGKGLNFAIVYGCGDTGIQSFLESHGVRLPKAEAIKLRAEHRKGWPVIQDFNNKVVYRVKNKRVPWGHFVQNQFGRVRRIEDPYQKAYTGVNHLIQGWAADLMKSGMARIERELHPTQWKQNIHDAIRIDLPLDWTEKQRYDYAREVVHRLTDFPQVTAPIRATAETFSTNWSEVKEVDLERDSLAA